MEYRRGSTAAFAKSLPNGHSFNGRSIYDGVFGGQREASRSVISDYGEIFGGSGASIPVLDVPELNESKIVVDVRSSKLDYSKIFGGFSEFDFPTSLDKPKMEKKTPVKARSHSESSFPSNILAANEVSSEEASNQSFDGIKKFKMSYNKTSPGSKNGTNGTMHVAQLHEVPGYSFLIDEMTPSKMTCTNKPVSSASHDSYPTINFSKGMMEVKHCRRTMSDLPPDVASKLSSRGDYEFQNQSNGNGSGKNGTFFDAREIGLGIQPSNVPRASSLLNGTSNRNCHSSKSAASMRQSSGDAAGLCSPPYFDEEVDVNSVAATSAAAVKKAIEEAQARIQMAKELKERKKESQQNRMKPSFDALKAKERGESRDTVKERKFKGRESWDIDTPVQTLSAMRKQNAIKPAPVAPDLGEREKLSIDNEAAGETHEMDFRSFQANHRGEEIEERKLAKEGETVKDAMQSLNEFVPEEKKTVENQEENGKKVEATEEASKHVAEEEQVAVTGLCDLQESKNKLKSADKVHLQKEDKNKLIFVRIWEKIEEMLGVSTELEASASKPIEAQKLAENKKEIEREELKDDDSLKRSEDALQCVDNEEKHEALKQESSTGLNDVPETEENQTMLQDIPMQEECGKISEKASEMVELEEEQKAFCGLEGEEKHDVCSGEYTEKVLGKIEKTEKVELGLNDFSYGEEKENKIEENDESGGNQEESEDVIEEAYEIKENEEIQNGASEWENTEMIQEKTDQSLEGEKTVETKEAYEIGTEVRQQRTSEWEDAEKIQEPTDQSVDGENMEEAFKCHRNVDEVTEDAYKQVEVKNLIKTEEPCRHEHFKGVEITPELFAQEDNVVIEELFAQEENVVIEDLTEACPQVKETAIKFEAVEVDNDVEYTGVFDASGLAEGISDLDEIKTQMENAREAFAFNRNEMNIGVQLQHDQHAIESEILCNIDTHVEELACESEESNQDFEEDGLVLQQENKCGPESIDGVRWMDNGESAEDDQLPCTFEGKEKNVGIASETETSQSMEKDEVNHYETLIETETKATSHEEIDLENEDQRKRDEAKEREREREKERLAVERAVREARERAFAEAREKAERAAAERANAEARRRARGKWEKPCTEANDKGSMEARIKAERAAVERATAEARQRALERAMSEKGAFHGRNQAEKFPADGFCGSSRDNGTKHTVRPYDSRSNGSHPSASSRYPSSSNSGVMRFDGANEEPVQRCKARLERHQRTAERAAKALAEKNMRDLIAQKEQAERNRLAETLDAEVKRWSKGKEGNLRPLLSTLQYILGPESGWQPIPLTDLIATAAVRKAYRKATLFVHPDKLQQRGASIQQKYTCEKVFDLLKAAWNKFIAEER